MVKTAYDFTISLLIFDLSVTALCTVSIGGRLAIHSRRPNSLIVHHGTGGIAHRSDGIFHGAAEPFHLPAVIFTRARIEDRNRRADHDAGRRPDGLRSPDADGTQRLTQTDIGIRHRLPGDKAVADKPDNFRAFGKFSMVQAVAGLQLGQIQNGDAGFFKLAAIGLDRWVDLAETIDIAGNTA